jgi:hypothetical protein
MLGSGAQEGPSGSYTMIMIQKNGTGLPTKNVISSMAGRQKNMQANFLIHIRYTQKTGVNSKKETLRLKPPVVDYRI